MNNNYPDDCQGRGQHLPWNEVDVYVCEDCGETITENDGGLCDECYEQAARDDNRTDDEEYKEVE